MKVFTLDYVLRIVAKLIPIAALIAAYFITKNHLPLNVLL